MIRLISSAIMARLSIFSSIRFLLSFSSLTFFINLLAVNLAWGATGSISAEPERCVIPAGQSICSTNISFSTSGATNACVWINHGNNNYQLAYCGTSSSFPAGYISKFGYTFELKEGNSSSGATLDSVYVVGEKTPSFMSQPVKGATLFYLNGRDQEDLPQIIEKLSDGDSACNGTTSYIDERLDETLSSLKSAGVNWIRVLVGRQEYHTYRNKCGIDFDNDIYPVMSQTYIDKLNYFLSKLTSPQFNFKIELLLAGKQGFGEINNDKLFFESILEGVSAKNIGLVMLGGDVQPLITSHGNWVKEMYSYFSTHSNSKLRTFAYSFDTITYNTPQQMKSYVTWVKDNIPGIPVISINLYLRDAPSTSSSTYQNQIKAYLEAYDEVGAYQPAWIDEYGFRLSSPTEPQQYDHIDQWEYYGGFLAETRCHSGYLKGRSYPSFAWTAGLDLHLANPSLDTNRTPWGLFSGYNSSNEPIVYPAWNLFSNFNNLSTGCP